MKEFSVMKNFRDIFIFISFVTISGMLPGQLRQRASINQDLASKMLIQATHQNNIKRIAYAIKCEANINCKSESGRTPLHIAALKGNFDAVIVLLGAGADPKALDANRRAPFELAPTGSDLRCLLENEFYLP